MLEKPDLPNALIAACLQAEYDLPVTQVEFLPLGADRNTAVYHITAADQAAYFLKLRRAGFDELSVALPKLFSDHGIRQIIPPLATRAGQLWAGLDPFRAVLYPFVEGRDVYTVALSDCHWIEFGAALKRIHTIAVPAALSSRIRRETFSSHWRGLVTALVERAQTGVFQDPVAAEVAALLRARRGQILDLVGRAERLAQALQAHTPPFVLCHSDLHAGNILIDANDDFYIVDWDDPVLAPKERDLMFIGGGQMARWRTPPEEEALFYQGYGPTPIEPAALAYYRYERIIQDIAAYCEELLLTNEGGEDRQQSLRYLKSNFLPGGVLELAYGSDQTTC